MPYDNDFISKIDSPKSRYSLLCNRLMEAVTNDADLKDAMSIANEASVGLRRAAAYGKANDLLTIEPYLRKLCLSIDNYQKNTPENAAKNTYLFGKSSNGNTALDWALQKATPEADPERGEYAICAALLLQFGFSAVLHLNDSGKSTPKPLYDFIKTYDVYEKMHAVLEFDKAYELIIEEKRIQRKMIHKAMHTLTAFYFMRCYEGALNILVDYLNDRGTKEIKVYEIGSSVPFELMALCAFFSSKNIKINYYGCDITESLINIATRLYERVNRNGDHVIAFEYVDAKTLADNPQHRRQVDLMLVRHPDIFGQTTAADFKHIFSKTIPAVMKPTGLMLVSHYWKEEAEALAPNFRAATHEHRSDFQLYNGGAVQGTQGTNRPYTPEQFSLICPGPQLVGVFDEKRKVVQKI